MFIFFFFFFPFWLAFCFVDKNVTAFHMIWLDLVASEMSHKTCKSEKDGLHYPEGNSYASLDKYRNACVREFIFPMLLTCESFAVIYVSVNCRITYSVSSHEGSYFLNMEDVSILHEKSVLN